MAATKTTPTTATDAAKDLAATAREQFLATLQQSQKLALDATNTWVGFVKKAVPSSPSIPTLPSMPGVATKAEIEEAINAGFSLIEEVVAAQRSFTQQLLGALTPATATPA